MTADVLLALALALDPVEVRHLPPQAGVAIALKQNRQACAYLQCQRWLDLPHAAFWQQALTECDRSYRAWDALQDYRTSATWCLDPDYRERYRREKRQELMRLIGCIEFQTGIMPDPVPLWAYREVR